jgi:hypothetical protein
LDFVTKIVPNPVRNFTLCVQCDAEDLRFSHFGRFQVRLSCDVFSDAHLSPSKVSRKLCHSPKFLLDTLRPSLASTSSSAGQSLWKLPHPSYLEKENFRFEGKTGKLGMEDVVLVTDTPGLDDISKRREAAAQIEQV